MNPLAVAILGYAVIVSSSLLLLFVLRALGKSTLWMPIEPAHPRSHMARFDLSQDKYCHPPRTSMRRASGGRSSPEPSCR